METRSLQSCSDGTCVGLDPQHPMADVLIRHLVRSCIEEEEDGEKEKGEEEEGKNEGEEGRRRDCMETERNCVDMWVRYGDIEEAIETEKEPCGERRRRLYGNRRRRGCSETDRGVRRRPNGDRSGELSQMGKATWRWKQSRVVPLPAEDSRISGNTRSWKRSGRTFLRVFLVLEEGRYPDFRYKVPRAVCRTLLSHLLYHDISRTR